MGFFDTDEPHEPEALPKCSKCGAETDTFYMNRKHENIGCDKCVRIVDAQDYKDEVS